MTIGDNTHLFREPQTLPEEIEAALLTHNAAVDRKARRDVGASAHGTHHDWRLAEEADDAAAVAEAELRAAIAKAVKPSEVSPLRSVVEAAGCTLDHVRALLLLNGDRLGAPEWTVEIYSAWPPGTHKRWWIGGRGPTLAVACRVACEHLAAKKKEAP